MNAAAVMAAPSAFVVDLAAIQAEVDAGYVNVARHPTAPISIYNYSQRAQFEGHWNHVTLQCRGLILDDDGRVVARPFPKFFNFEQVAGQIPNEPFDVMEKLDGSLGISYWLDGQICLATRGSFTSEQAIRGTEMLRAMVPGTGPHAVVLDPQFTFLFEIIYPENKIVVDYGGASRLVLLAAIHRETGEEFPDLARVLPFEQPRFFPGVRRVDHLLGIDKPNEEGFVVRFRSGVRVKVKMADYCRLHKLLTGVSPKSIWEHLKAGRPFEEIVERSPDEFHAWAGGVRDQLLADYAAIEAQAREDFKGWRRVVAEYFKTCDNPAILFQMLDERPYDQHIWKLLRPTAARAFRCDGEAA